METLQALALNVSLVFWLSTESAASAATSPSFFHEVVDATASVGLMSSLALDAEDEPHLAYYDSTNDLVKYARRTGEQWVFETVGRHRRVPITRECQSPSTRRAPHT